jgi:hypothetical protein
MDIIVKEIAYQALKNPNMVILLGELLGLSDEALREVRVKLEKELSEPSIQTFNNPGACEHEPDEDCMTCFECGESSENLDDEDVCSKCRASNLSEGEYSCKRCDARHNTEGPDLCLNCMVDLKDIKELGKDDVAFTFTNHYRCPDCKTEWSDTWTTTCDDDCPTCRTTCSPYTM